MNTQKIDRRFGIIRYTASALKQLPDCCSRVFSRLAPLMCEFDLARDHFVLTAWSREFDLLCEGEEIPDYAVVANRRGHAVFTEFVRLQNRSAPLDWNDVRELFRGTSGFSAPFRYPTVT